MTNTSSANIAHAPLRLGSTTRHDVVARTAAHGQLVVLGSVFSPAAAAQLAAEAEQAGLTDVQVALHYSRADFDTARRAAAQPARQGT